ncbi:MAG: penicillin-binding protein activator [Deltaproteobacteria bacterium]|nr:penicillin-binding protein activator [Deltaproteobacteria bacterium]
MKPAITLIALLAALSACTPPAAHLPPAPAHAFRRAEDAFARGAYEPAAAAYRQFLNSTPDPAYAPRAAYQLALAQYHLQQYGAALVTLDELKQRVPGQQWVQVYALRGDAELGLGRRVAALLAWEEAWQLAGPAEQARLQNRIGAVRPQLTDDERAEVSEVLVTAAVREALGLGDLMAAAPMPPFEIAAVPAPPEVAAVEEESEPAVTNGAEPLPPATEEEAAVPPALGDEAEAPPEAVEVAVPAPGPTTKIACLLPLTGVDRAYGQRALAGLRLAFADAPEQLVVRDTGGDPASSAELLQALHQDSSVVAVVGPLRSSEAEVLAPLAERERLPLLLLSQREGLAGRFVFQVAMTRGQQAEMLVRYAADTLKVQRFGVLYPEDGYGSAFAQAFIDAVAAQGASVVGTQAYEPGNPDLAAAAGAVRRWHQAGLQALFIPDAAATAAAVAAQVREGLPDVALLGTESWNDAAALSRAGDVINGAVFTDAFFASSTRASTREFVERFERGEGRQPTVFEAQAFDAGLALRRLIAGGATSREQIVGQLNGLGRFEGAGQLQGTPGGFGRALSILRYRDGQVEEVAPATDG